MRISDWSSDVCSSDLIALNVGPRNESGVTKGPGWRAPSPATSGSRPLFVDALRLAPLARGGVAEIAGAEERVERLRDAGEIGVHALCDRARHVGPARRAQPHRDRPEPPRVHDVKEDRASAGGPRIGRPRFGEDPPERPLA